MRERIDQIVTAWRTTRELDDRLLWWVLGVGLGTLAVFLALGWWLLGPVVGAAAGVALGLLAAALVFGRRSQQAQISEIAGMPGAAAAVLQSMRGQWFVTPVVAVTGGQELVHRVVGRPGVILVGEGPSRSKVSQLLAQERKKMSRVVGSGVPVHTVLVDDGDDDDSVPLKGLQTHVAKLPREVDKGDVPKLHRKLKPLDKGNIPVPKGYLGNLGNRRR